MGKKWVANQIDGKYRKNAANLTIKNGEPGLDIIEDALYEWKSEDGETKVIELTGDGLIKENGQKIGEWFTNDFQMSSNQFTEGKYTELKVSTDSAFEQLSLNITFAIGYQKMY